MAKSDLGQIQIYTGSGKGKTTAALGLGIRSTGAGLVVYLISFMKNRSSEHIILDSLRPGFDYYIGNRKPRSLFWKLSAGEREEAATDARLAWDKAQSIIAAGGCDLLILDEIMALLKYGIVTVSELLDLMDLCARQAIELVLTGRDVPPEILATATLVTEMKAVKHPLEDGIKARKGIEY